MKTLSTLAIVAGFLCLASLALADSAERETYKAAVEPICKKNTKLNERIFKGVKTEVKQGKLKPAALAFEKASKALKATIVELEAVPQPPADATHLSKWLSYAKTEASLFASTAKKLRANKKSAAEALVVRLTHTANLANDQVIAFGFHYCKLEPSKFT